MGLNSQDEYLWKNNDQTFHGQKGGSAMTIDEYQNQKQVLERKMKELEVDWIEGNRSIYDVNIGKYYKSTSSKTIGVITNFSSGKYSCKEITCDYDGVFVETLQDWSTTTMLSQFEFISRTDFDELFEGMINQLRDKAAELIIT